MANLNALGVRGVGIAPRMPPVKEGGFLKTFIKSQFFLKGYPLEKLGLNLTAVFGRVFEGPRFGPYALDRAHILHSF